MINLLFGAFKVIVLLGTLITIHEFGHFIVAKLCNIKVHKFSIGFGPKLLHKQGKETEYSLRLIPLGGFVQLEGEDEESDDERSFSQKPIWQRVLVLLAGVTMNIFLALSIYLIIYMSINRYTTTMISSASNEDSLIQYGLNVGDEIKRVNGTKVYNDADIARIVSDSDSDEFEFEIVRANNELVKKQITIKSFISGYIGVAFSDKTVAQVLPGSRGLDAGLKNGDIIVGVGEKQEGTIYDYLAIIKENAEKELKITVDRNGEIVSLTIIPEAINKREFRVSFIEVSNLDFAHNLYYAWKETKYYLRANLIGIGELISGNTKNVELQGIVGVSQQISNTQSIIEFFYFMSAISLSLGIMNLLPIPGLDGGKLFIVLIEAIRRKPMKKETEAMITLAGFAFLMFLMIWVTTQDISKLIK